MLRDMKLIFAALVFGAFFAGGCARTQRDDQTAAEFLGPGAVYVLQAPTRIEGWNFQRPDGTIASDPAIRPLDLSIARDLAAILLNEQTYRQPARGGAFERTVGYRVWRDNGSVEVLVSFNNDQLLLKYLAYNGQPTTSLAGASAAHDALLQVTRKAFPDYKPTSGR
jgi:hypothetical protein